jgi:hypothetical protein
LTNTSAAARCSGRRSCAVAVGVVPAIIPGCWMTTGNLDSRPMALVDDYVRAADRGPGAGLALPTTTFGPVPAMATSRSCDFRGRRFTGAVERILGKDYSKRCAWRKSNSARSGRIGNCGIRNGGIPIPFIIARAPIFPFLGAGRARGRESENDCVWNQAHSLSFRRTWE